MFELLSVLGGGLFRLLPSVLDFFHKKQELSHELDLLDKQMELAKLQGEQKIAEIQQQTDGDTERAWGAALSEAIKSQGTPTGVRWVDALSASVRPVVTYWWALVLYTAAKGIEIYVALSTAVPLLSLAPILLTDFDRAVIGSILGFWFCDRALRQLGR
jgi:hypothetical protein